uniref:NADH-ubiquinone oxidoreductase chain 3 n=1 Tax=Eudohrnia metallica TaxID=2021301 RepID=A0A678RFI9_9NEOP|nr:NADH dehydrogenase subunit 3 [Eudohrnia metallica]
MFLEWWTGVGLTGLSCLVLIVAVGLGRKMTHASREKNSPFECGFDPRGALRLPFSLQFFLIAVVFLVFDVEVVLLLPLVVVMVKGNPVAWGVGGGGFLGILMGGLYFEWHQGALNWAW